MIFGKEKRSGGPFDVPLKKLDGERGVDSGLPDLDFFQTSLKD